LRNPMTAVCGWRMCMKRWTAVCVLALLLCGGISANAQTTNPDRDRLTIEPIPVRSASEAKDKEEDVDPLSAIGGYFVNRFRDLADILTLKLGWGNYRSIGVQARVTTLAQVGIGNFEGWVVAIDRGCVGVMKEAVLEGGVSIFYPSFIARKVRWQTEEAERKNIFFGDVGEEKNELTKEDLLYYDDENAHPLTVTAQVQLPCLPRIELTLNLGEIPDFVISLFGIDGFRVPAPFHKQYRTDEEKGERIPAPSIFWHGQEKYERYD
jgi:hypothetical protein